MTADPTPDTVPTRPLRNWLLAWQIWTGDTPATIACGFGLDPELVVELLADGHPRMLSLDEATGIAGALGASVGALFGRGGCDGLWSEVPEQLAAALRHL